MKQCKCGSYAFNLYKEDIDQGDLCDVHYWKEKALAQPEQPDYKTLAIQLQQRTWVGSGDLEDSNSYLVPSAQRNPLTDKQVREASLKAGMQEHYMGFHSGFIRFARAIEAAHGIKE